MVIPNFKKQDSVLGPSLSEISDWYEDKDIDMGEIALLVERERIKVEDILTENSTLEILSREVSKINQQEKVKSDSLNIPLVE